MRRTIIIDNGEVFLNGNRISFKEEKTRSLINKIFRDNCEGWEQ